MADFSIENCLQKQGFYNIAGVDEAGRGPLAGPVVAAAVILDCCTDIFYSLYFTFLLQSV